MDIVENVDNPGRKAAAFRKIVINPIKPNGKTRVRFFARKKISTSLEKVISPKFVDIVDSYFSSRLSPILTTSPAPIVINRSPFMQFINKNFSISSKEGR